MLITIIFITILGAIMGSFLGCMGYRIPNKIKTTYPSSFCESCHHPLKWYMNIPILSYIILKGKCAYCGKQIEFIYPFVEIAGASLFLCNYLLFGFTYNFFICTIITCMLLVTIVSDFMYYYISDRVLVIGSLALLAVNYYFLTINQVFYNIVAAVIIFGIMYFIKICGNITFKKESLGDGDIKLMGVIALGLGLINSFVTLFFGSLIGLIFSIFSIKKNKNGIIPFGPFLLIGALVALYFSNLITPFIDKFIIG